VIPWPFISLTVLVGLVLYAHFFFAHRQLRALRTQEPLEINWRYVQIEDYFGQSFRQKLGEWLQDSPAQTDPNADAIVSKGNESIRLTGAITYARGTTIDDILAVSGDLTSDAACTFTRELYVKGNCRIAEQNRLQALAVDGRVDLGAGSEVMRWLDGSGAVTIGRKCRVGARVTSRETVRLGVGAEVGSVFAPRVATESLREEPNGRTAGGASTPVLIPPDSADDKSNAAGINPGKLFKLTTDCWLYKGDLEPSAPLHVTTKLIVKGRLRVPEGSVLESDVKADRSLDVGSHSTCRGNVIAGGDIVLGPSVTFAGVIHAGRNLWLSQGVRGQRPDATVAAYAVRRVYAAKNVAVYGKIAAGERVVVAPDSAFNHRSHQDPAASTESES
jgi:cytoskeletal protein CcmA (bactofilin family)